jgi:hypothetical protein
MWSLNTTCVVTAAPKLEATSSGGRSLRLPPGVFRLRACGSAGTGGVAVEGSPADHEVVIAIGPGTRT